MRHPICHPTTHMCHTHMLVLGETRAHMVIACLIHTLSTFSNNLLQCDTQSFVCVHFFFCLSLSVLLAHSTKHSVWFIRSDCPVCLEACQIRAGDNWGSEVDRKSGGLCCERKGRVQWGRSWELRGRRELYLDWVCQEHVGTLPASTAQ